MLDNYKIIAVTHKTTDLETVGKFYVSEEKSVDILSRLKEDCQLEELMYLATCNRIEFITFTPQLINEAFLQKIASYFGVEDISCFNVYEAESAVRHMFDVVASLDSMVVGEREIITQVRKSFDFSREHQLSGDNIRLLMKRAIELGKEIYTQTEISAKPVSVVSLAFRQLFNDNLERDTKIIVVGAGDTNRTMVKLLSKHQFPNVTVFNRTFSKAEEIVKSTPYIAKQLDDLVNFKGGFDVLISCTGSLDAVITKDIYEKILLGDTSKKKIIDIAIPNDIDKSIIDEFDVEYISVEKLKEEAQKNLETRKKEIQKCSEIIEYAINDFRHIHKERQVENAMNQVPNRIKEIKSIAVNEVFVKEIENLDDNSKEILDKVIAYMEKKYISIPMKMAKEILLDKVQKK